MRFLRFLSLTTATQVCLLINQLFLLPLQLRIWGHVATADWFVVVAIANLATVSDLGLRVAGHAPLFSSVKEGDAAAAAEFRETWALARALFLGVTAALLAGQVLWAWRTGAPFGLWVWALTISLTVDTAVIVRGVYLDTLGRFNQVEGLFLALVAVRLALSFAALLLFHAQPPALAWIFLATAVVGAAAQARLLPEPRSLAFSAGGLLHLRLRALGIVRLVVAEPAANWVRLSLPVIVLAAISPPLFVTTYVALRAGFGLARQVVNQVGRYASVAYVQRAGAEMAGAERIVIRAILLCTVVATGVSAGVLADRGRLIGLWLAGADPRIVAAAALCFAVGATAYGYQVTAGVLMRTGDVAGVARRQYAYLAAAAAAAVLGLLLRSPYVYLVLLAAEELFIAALFAGALGTRVFRAAAAAFALAAAGTGGLALAAQLDPAGLFSRRTPAAVVECLAAGGLVVAFVALGCLVIDARAARAAPARIAQTSPA